MRALAPLLAAVALATAAPAQAQLASYVEDCVEGRTPRTVIDGCIRALKSGKLNRQQEARLFVNRGTAFFEREQYTLSLRDYQLAEQRDPSIFEIYANRGNAHLRLDQPHDALAAYDRALSMRPDDKPSMLGRGSALLMMRRYNEAIDAYGRAIRLDPRDPRPYYNRGLAYLHSGNGRSAAADFSQTIRRDGQDYEAYGSRGRARELVGDLNGAHNDYAEAVRIRPDFALAWFRKGRLLYNDGRRGQALADLKRAYDLGWDDPWLAQVIVEATR